MSKDELIQLFDNNKEDISKYEKNKKRIREIDYIIKKLKENNETKTTTSYKEISSGKTNTINNTVEDCIKKKDEKIRELEEEKTELEAENIMLKSKIEDVEIVLKALKFKERTIIVEHYIEGNSYEDIGNRIFWKIFGQTRDWQTIKRIADKAMKKMLKL